MGILTYGNPPNLLYEWGGSFGLIHTWLWKIGTFASILAVEPEGVRLHPGLLAGYA